MPEQDQREYTLAERRSYQSPPCPVCGGPTRQHWIPVKTLSDHVDRYMPGSYECLNPWQHREEDR